jgi:hypothetical protein
MHVFASMGAQYLPATDLTATRCRRRAPDTLLVTSNFFSTLPSVTAHRSSSEGNTAFRVAAQASSTPGLTNFPVASHCSASFGTIGCRVS